MTPHTLTVIAALTMAAAAHAQPVSFDTSQPARIVKGAPYCADAVHETVQWLPDPAGAAANRIVQRQTTRLCRDGEGRTRQEIEHNGRKLVYLNDPVAGEYWVLDPERKSARRSRSSSTAAHAETFAAEWRDYAARMREWARGQTERVRTPGATAASPQAPATPPTPPSPPPPMPALVAPMHGIDGPLVQDGAREGMRDVQVRVLRLPGDEMLALPAVDFRAHQFGPRGAGVVSAMPSQDIEGLRANGERTTWTIAAGKVGNDKPIVSSREVWTSPELMLTLRSAEIDPRRGETHYRLQQIKRGEPDAGLMRVPADYSGARTRDKPAS